MRHSLSLTATALLMLHIMIVVFQQQVHVVQGATSFSYSNSDSQASSNVNIATPTPTPNPTPVYPVTPAPPTPPPTLGTRLFHCNMTFNKPIWKFDTDYWRFSDAIANYLVPTELNNVTALGWNDVSGPLVAPPVSMFWVSITRTYLGDSAALVATTLNNDANAWLANLLLVANSVQCEEIPYIPQVVLRFDDQYWCSIRFQKHAADPVWTTGQHKIREVVGLAVGVPPENVTINAYQLATYADGITPLNPPTTSVEVTIVVSNASEKLVAQDLVADAGGDLRKEKALPYPTGCFNPTTGLSWVIHGRTVTVSPAEVDPTPPPTPAPAGGGSTSGNGTPIPPKGSLKNVSHGIYPELAVTARFVCAWSVEYATLYMPQIRQDIADSVFVPVENVTILSILPGSTVVEFQVKTTNHLNETDILAQIEAAANTTFSNYSLSDAQVVVVYVVADTTPAPPTSPEVVYQEDPVAIVVVVAAGVVLLVVVGVVTAVIIIRDQQEQRDEEQRRRKGDAVWDAPSSSLATSSSQNTKSVQLLATSTDRTTAPSATSSLSVNPMSVVPTQQQQQGPASYDHQAAALAEQHRQLQLQIQQQQVMLMQQQIAFQNQQLHRSAAAPSVNGAGLPPLSPVSGQQQRQHLQQQSQSPAVSIEQE